MRPVPRASEPILFDTIFFLTVLLSRKRFEGEKFSLLTRANLSECREC